MGGKNLTPRNTWSAKNTTSNKTKISNSNTTTTTTTTMVRTTTTTGTTKMLNSLLVQAAQPMVLPFLLVCIWMKLARTLRKLALLILPTDGTVVYLSQMVD